MAGSERNEGENQESVSSKNQGSREASDEDPAEPSLESQHTLPRNILDSLVEKDTTSDSDQDTSRSIAGSDYHGDKRYNDGNREDDTRRVERRTRAKGKGKHKEGKDDDVKEEDENPVSTYRPTKPIQEVRTRRGFVPDYLSPERGFGIPNIPYQATSPQFRGSSSSVYHPYTQPPDYTYPGYVTQPPYGAYPVSEIGRPDDNRRGKGRETARTKETWKEGRTVSIEAEILRQKVVNDGDRRFRIVETARDRPGLVTSDPTERRFEPTGSESRNHSKTFVDGVQGRDTQNEPEPRYYPGFSYHTGGGTSYGFPSAYVQYPPYGTSVPIYEGAKVGDHREINQKAPEVIPRRDGRDERDFLLLLFSHAPGQMRAAEAYASTLNDELRRQNEEQETRLEKVREERAKTRTTLQRNPSERELGGRSEEDTPSIVSSEHPVPRNPDLGEEQMGDSTSANHSLGTTAVDDLDQNQGRTVQAFETDTRRLIVWKCKVCVVVYALWLLVIGGSCAVAFWRSVIVDEGTGFTDAAYVVAVGGIIVFPIQNRHFEQCPARRRAQH